MIVWLASYPRSGNTFLRIIFAHLLGLDTYSLYDDPFDIANNANTSRIVGHRNFPLLQSIPRVRRDSRIWPIKTHELPAKHPNKEDKLIYILRDGRDATASYYHYLRKYQPEYPLPEGAREVIRGHVPFGNWADHVTAWQASLSRHGLVLKFDEVVTDPAAAAELIGEYVGIQTSGSEAPRFADLNRLNPSFFRGGKSNSWKTTLTEADHTIFWMLSADQMLKHGYTDSCPEFVDQGVSAELDSAVQEIRQLHARCATELRPRYSPPKQRLRRLIQRLQGR